MRPLCEGRVCLVTGAGRGLGRSFALALAAAGADAVVVNDLGVAVDGGGVDSGPAAHVSAHIAAMGCPSLADNSDVADWTAAHDMIERTVQRFGRLDVLVNNAGIFELGSFIDLTEPTFDAIWRVNGKGAAATAHAAARHWQSRHAAGERIDARLINVTSTAGLYAVPSMSAYGMSKTAVATLTQTLSQELLAFGVTVNAVAPGAWTRMTERLPAAGIDLSHVASSGFSPDDVAPLITWLASSESSDVTGQVFEANGGMLAVVEGWRQGPARRPMPAVEDYNVAVREMLQDATPRTRR